LSSTNFEKLHEFQIQGSVTKRVISLEKERLGVLSVTTAISSSCVVTLKFHQNTEDMYNS